MSRRPDGGDSSKRLSGRRPLAGDREKETGMVAEKRWSEMSPQELLDVAQRKFNAAEEYPNVRALRMEEARQTLAAAQVQAIENLSWTLQNRTQIGMPEHHGPMPL